MESNTKRCPYCGEEILGVAKKCKHCGEWLEKPEAEKPDDTAISRPMFFTMLTIAVASSTFYWFFLMWYILVVPFGVNENSLSASIPIVLAFILSLALAIKVGVDYNKHSASFKRSLSAFSAYVAVSIWFIIMYTTGEARGYGPLYIEHLHNLGLIALLISLAFAVFIYLLSYRKDSEKASFNVFSSVVIAMTLIVVCILSYQYNQ